MKMRLVDTGEGADMLDPRCQSALAAADDSSDIQTKLTVKLS